MTATDKALVLDAWGGKVGAGEECWIIDTIAYTLTPVSSAVVVEVDYEPRLFHENRFYKSCYVACTEPAARRTLERFAREAIDESTKRMDAARRFLATLA
jgi:hypothetical protein